MFTTSITTIMCTLNQMPFETILDTALYTYVPTYTYIHIYTIIIIADHSTIIIEHTDAVRKISRNQLLQ